MMITWTAASLATHFEARRGLVTQSQMHVFHS